VRGIFLCVQDLYPCLKWLRKEGLLREAAAGKGVLYLTLRLMMMSAMAKLAGKTAK